MTLAIPGLLIILGILPGIIFFNTFYSGQFARRFTKITPLVELSSYILIAVFLDIAFLYYYPETTIGKIKLELLTLASKGSLEGIPIEALQNHIKDWSGDLAWSVSHLFLFSFLIGFALNRIVWASRLDLRIPFLKMKCEWYYSLWGRDKSLKRWHTLVYADVLTVVPENRTILYRGVVEKFEIAKDNIALSHVSLISAQRDNGKRGKLFQWKDIPGDKIILLGSNIQSINLTYIPVEANYDVCDYMELFFKSLFLGRE